MVSNGLHDGEDTTSRPCRRCQHEVSVIVVRTEPLCKACFNDYVRKKIIKRMESFNFQVRHSKTGEKRTLLLPMSFGASSLSLLHVLDEQLKRQISKTNQTGYALHVLHVHDPFFGQNGGKEDVEKRMEALKNAFPEHQFSTTSLEDIYCIDPRAGNGETHTGRSQEMGLETTSSTAERLQAFLTSIAIPTSRIDALTTLRTRLVVSFAKANSCEGILWSHTTTRMAESILSETSKGRGFGLPWQVQDGLSPFGLSFYYPMRELLKREVIAFTELADFASEGVLAEEEVKKVTSRKDQTIDGLMKAYFEGVEETYLSIVANVVRTAGKLEPPAYGHEDANRCRMCLLPVTDGRFGIHDWSGDQEKWEPGSDETGRALCYGCTRTLEKTSIALLP